MRKILCLPLVICSYLSYAQQIEIPKGVVYKYADSTTNEKAKAVITLEIEAPKYILSNKIVFVGPVLWGRYKNVEPLKGIKNGNVTIRGYKEETSSGKMTQTPEDFRLLWDYLRSEIKGQIFA